MHYKKPPISFNTQLDKLKQRGLIVNNDQYALACLQNISYYRLRAYTFSFQDNDDENHPFVKKVSFDEIITLYKFDRKLSLLIFEAIEKIEVALRTQIIYQWAMSHGSHWQTNPNLYRNSIRFAKQLDTLQAEIDRAKETFIEHYKENYSKPEQPPSWMSLEVSSFGLLSQIFSNLKKGKEKIAVAKYFGLNDIALVENWMLCFSNIRNICAHHGRLWNRRLTAHIKIPTNPDKLFIKNRKLYQYKLYPALCCMQYILQQINMENDFKPRLKELMKTCPLAQEKEMGFPADWLKEKFWE